MLVGRVLFVHWQSLICGAVCPDEDGGADDVFTVSAAIWLGGAPVETKHELVFIAGGSK